ncbi:MAG: hypothetical protein WCW87_01835 [Candidatus Paceibacterota bacterium]
MVLSTHMVVGALLAQQVSNPFVAFFVGFLSHFVLDAIPHWDYEVKALIMRDKENKLNSSTSVNLKSLYDLIKIGCDVLLGFIIIFIIFKIYSLDQILESQNLYILIGAIGGATPDFLQFVFFHWKNNKYIYGLLVNLQKFHMWIHSQKKTLTPIVGITFQVIVVIIAFICLR